MLVATLSVIIFGMLVISKVYEQSAKLAISQHEAGAKYAITMVQVSEKLGRYIDEVVKSRIKIVNSAGRPSYGSETASAAPIEEAPPPPIFQSGVIGEVEEYLREMNRPRRDGSEFDARDVGVGQEAF